MKIIILFISILLSSASIRAQNNEVLNLLNKKNAPITKKVDSIGNIEEKIFFDLITLEDMLNGNILKGVLISVVRKGQTISNVLDKSETQTFIAALKRLSMKLDDTEFKKSAFRISSGSGLSISSSFDPSGVWIHKIEIKKSYLDPAFHFDNKGIDEIIDFLSKGLSKM
ncbi:hypothetical protein D3C86_1518560 [compost metagenome]